MHYLLVQVLSVVCFTQLLRYSQRRGWGVAGTPVADNRRWRPVAVSAVNYVTAAVIAAVMLAGAWLGKLPPAGSAGGGFLAAGLGVLAGAGYFLHLLILLAAYERAGVGITSAVTALGILIPVAVSWLAWAETMTPGRWLALALLAPAALLLRPGGDPKAGAPALDPPLAQARLDWRADLFLLLSFVVSGTVATIQKTFTRCAGEDFRPLYQATLFAVAAAVSTLYVVGRFRRPGPGGGGPGLHLGRSDLLLGSALGAVNVLATVFLLLSLQALPAVVFFPTSSSLAIILSVIVSRVLWRERVTARQGIGLLLAVAIVVLVNL